MPPEPLRNWFVPGEGIDRNVISADIQRYLGNDATVRPGRGTGEHQGVDGFWIKAYRNLTSAMMEDLRRDSQTWRKEQSRTGTREPYTRSETFERSHKSNSSRPLTRPNGDSPMRESTFSSGQQPPRDSRMPPSDPMQMDRMPTDRNNRMPPMDPVNPPPDMRHGPPSGRNYTPDSRPYPNDGRGYPQDERPYSQDQSMQGTPYPRASSSAPYGPDPRYGPSYPQPPMDGPPTPGYVRQGNIYVPVTSPYDAPPGMAPVGRSDSAPFGASPFGGPPPGPQGRDPRDQRDQREPPRFGQNEFPDPRYPYAPPAPGAPPLAGPGRESVTSPPQPSYPPPPGQFTDQYGRPVQPNFGPPGQDPGYPPPPREQGYNSNNRDRPHAPPPPPPEYNNSSSSSNSRDRPPPSSSDSRDARRRRVH